MEEQSECTGDAEDGLGCNRIERELPRGYLVGVKPGHYSISLTQCLGATTD